MGQERRLDLINRNIHRHSPRRHGTTRANPPACGLSVLLSGARDQVSAPEPTSAPKPRGLFGQTSNAPANRALSSTQMRCACDHHLWRAGTRERRCARIPPPSCLTWPCTEAFRWPLADSDTRNTQTNCHSVPDSTLHEQIRHTQISAIERFDIYSCNYTWMSFRPITDPAGHALYLPVTGR